MTERERSLLTFLSTAGWWEAARTALAGDASMRRYERLVRGDRTMVLMDAPPPGEAVGPFVAIARLLSDWGYSAPTIHAVDEEQGFVLLEDLGDDTFDALLSGKPGATLEDTLYEAATDLLLDLHHKEPLPDLPRYDSGWLLRDAALFLETAWSDGATAAPEAVRQTFAAAWDAPLSRVAEDVPVLCLRDFHVGNLIWLPARGDGVRRVGLLDFQDARLAPACYDLVSLLQDARRDLRPGLAEAMVTRYLGDAAQLDGDAFHASYAILGAQRCVRIIGVFMRLAQRDGKPAYLAHLPRVWGHLEDNLAHPALAPVRAWFDAWLPMRREGGQP